MHTRMAAAVGSAVFLLFITSDGGPARAEIGESQRIVGTVTAESGSAIAGAVVKLKNLQNLVIRSYITEADGSFQFAVVSRDTGYDVWAEHNGCRSDTKTLSRFETDKVLRVRLEVESDDCGS